MKCFHCRKEITDMGYLTTVPDGDTFHNNCYEQFKLERDYFFDVIIHDDAKYRKWLRS